jgi:hypothetical protein
MSEDMRSNRIENCRSSSPAMKRFECRAILFDLDGVLVDSTAHIEEQWRRWATAKGLSPEPFLRVCHGRRAIETIRLAAPHLDAAAEVAAFQPDDAADALAIKPIAGAARLLETLPVGTWAVATSGPRAVSPAQPFWSAPRMYFMESPALMCTSWLPQRWRFPLPTASSLRTLRRGSRPHELPEWGWWRSPPRTGGMSSRRTPAPALWLKSTSVGSTTIPAVRVSSSCWCWTHRDDAPRSSRILLAPPPLIAAMSS